MNHFAVGVYGLRDLNSEVRDGRARLCRAVRLILNALGSLRSSHRAYLISASVVSRAVGIFTSVM